MTKSLSITTQNVLDASMVRSASPPPQLHRESIAAALRAAVDAVVPESKCYRDTSDGTMRSTDLLMVRRIFYAIIKELDEIK